jgi:DNA processing protein
LAVHERPDPGPDPWQVEPKALSQDERLARLRLIRSANVGPVSFFQLIEHCGDAASALEALPELSRRGGRSRTIKICAKEDAEAELVCAERTGAKLVALGEDGYPPWLALVDTPPPLLYTKGDRALLDRPMVGIVGARNASAIGCKFARELAADLGKADFVIASGLARGIDAAAHRASLGLGTVAAVAGGIDIVYLPEHADLQKEIGVRGMLISEQPPGFRPRGQDFPRRNRLISGMSLAVIVVEAAKRSGSLITARFAGEQGREVFAVPGNPLDPRAAGTNGLLKDGAGLLTCAEDVISALEPILGHAANRVEEHDEENTYQARPMAHPNVGPSDRSRVADALGYSPVDLDEVIRQTGLDVRVVHVILLELDLAGHLERHGLQMVSLRE